MITTTRAQMTMPLRSGDKIHGILLLETSDPTDFSQAVFEAVELLASRAAVAMENALVNEMRDRLVKDLDSFAHTVAHDLKNPLNVMLGYGEMLKAMNLPDEAKKVSERIIYAALQASDIVDALLALAQASNVEDGRPEPMEMASAVGGVISRLHLMIEQSGAEITTPTDWPNVMAYRPWVEEAWANYITNAIKYGGKPPRVELGWEVQPDQHFRFWVQDNGSGLTSEQIGKLFQPFVRLDTTTSDGYGLGLSIVQRITEKLGGKVGVDSTIGQGSKFYFTLPAAQAPAAKVIS
jgi:signal transduction histidine kinase